MMKPILIVGIPLSETEEETNRITQTLSEKLTDHHVILKRGGYDLTFEYPVNFSINTTSAVVSVKDINAALLTSGKV